MIRVTDNGRDGPRATEEERGEVQGDFAVAAEEENVVGHVVVGGGGVGWARGCKWFGLRGCQLGLWQYEGDEMDSIEWKVEVRM